MRSEHTEATQGHLRTLNLNIVFASLSAIGALLISNHAETPVQAVVLGVGVVAAVLASRGWSEDRVSPLALACLVATAAVWLVGVLVLDNTSASFGISVVGTVVVFQLPRPRRGAAALALGAFVVAVVAVRLVMSPGDVLGVLLEYAVGSTSVAVVGVILVFLNYVVSGLIKELEEAREREAELAVARERVRFASDLHDIQGHTLHVVKLKTALARKLVRSDTGRAEEELREIHALVGDTITQTKALAYAQRRLNLSAELENAKNLFEAAGIRVRVDPEAEVDPRAGEMLGQVLRETTTNILRHAQADQVRVTLAKAGITIANDGAREGPLPELSGLSTLRERVADSGGELTVEQSGGWFLTAATFPHLRSDTAR
ncbi:histidine kinase [Nocardiopsis sp. CT-R113]|uniref:Histidine kinase n=1 Tax=Nocardiopsis codii TaxID=3065942 RepID=A0ABU7K5V7_9ACTN|nr:histidine kinase [Nocardiopsis sp. CT-R113]MEE2037633.1 histidine kinase [Nocardiopsis sp. CT-R113]